MSVALGSPDSFGYLVAVYLCGCGRTEVCHGRAAGELPRGWVVLRGGDDPDHACPDCAAAQRR